MKCPKSISKTGVNNPMFGKKHTEQTIRKMKKIKLSENNPMWRGDGVGYFSLHEWVNRHKGKQFQCEDCGRIGKLDLANISGEYKRDLDDWEYLCRKCHMAKDGRLEKLKNMNIERTTGWVHSCNYCGSPHWVTPGIWDKGIGRYCGKICSNKGRSL